MNDYQRMLLFVFSLPWLETQKRLILIQDERTELFNALFFKWPYRYNMSFKETLLDKVTSYQSNI